VQFISLDADDVIYQDGGSAFLSATPAAAPETTSSGAQLPNGTVTYNHGYTGDLKIVAADNAAVPDRSHGTPNLQTLWLEETLARARRHPDVDMIVVFMHQCAMSTSVPGNGSDLGIRRAWLPLFDRYGVDLVLSGHEHDDERTFPVRGYDAGKHGTVVSPNPDQTPGSSIDTRRPAVVSTPSPAPRRPASSATRPTPSRTRPGRRPPTPATPTAMPSSTSTRASGRAGPGPLCPGPGPSGRIAPPRRRDLLGAGTCSRPGGGDVTLRCPSRLPVGTARGGRR
jgi:hypothetical protein